MPSNGPVVFFFFRQVFLGFLEYIAKCIHLVSNMGDNKLKCITPSQVAHMPLWNVFSTNPW